MTSDGEPREAHVWLRRAGGPHPVVAGRLAQADQALIFNYGRSYVARPTPRRVARADRSQGARAPVAAQSAKLQISSYHQCRERTFATSGSFSPRGPCTGMPRSSASARSKAAKVAPSSTAARSG